MLDLSSGQTRRLLARFRAVRGMGDVVESVLAQLRDGVPIIEAKRSFASMNRPSRPAMTIPTAAWLKVVRNRSSIARRASSARRRSVTSWKTMTAPETSPVMPRIGAALSSMAITSPLRLISAV